VPFKPTLRCKRRLLHSGISWSCCIEPYEEAAHRGSFRFHRTEIASIKSFRDPERARPQIHLAPPHCQNLAHTHGCHHDQQDHHANLFRQLVSRFWNCSGVRNGGSRLRRAGSRMPRVTFRSTYDHSIAVLRILLKQRRIVCTVSGASVSSNLPINACTSALVISRNL
jgi:hypothetical protein